VNSRRLAAELLAGMEELGQTEGRDFEIVHLGAGGNPDAIQNVVAEAVAAHPDLIFASSTVIALRAKEATSTIPIVVPVLAEPIALGLIQSEARPGGNLTGLVLYLKGLPAKQVELAREIVPGAARIGFLVDVTDPRHLQRSEIERTGEALHVTIVPAEIRSSGEIAAAYETFASERVHVVIVQQSTMLYNSVKELTEVAKAKRLATVYGYREHVAAGGLISYGINIKWCFRRAAYYVDRILKGARPADLPVEFPTKLELVVNINTAKALGLTVPPTLLARADEVIE